MHGHKVKKKIVTKWGLTYSICLSIILHIYYFCEKEIPEFSKLNQMNLFHISSQPRIIKKEKK